MSFLLLIRRLFARSDRYQTLLFWAAVSMLFCLYGSVAFFSYGFDDEFHNIRIVENLQFFDGMSYVQSNDVHPPLSYAYNYLLYWLSGSWPIVRVIGGIALVASISWYSICSWRRDGWENGILFLLFTGLNPAILMWGTSVRWYSLYLIILFWMLAPQGHASKARSDLNTSTHRLNWVHLKPVLCLLLLGYTGYITIVLAIPFMIFYYYYSVRLTDKIISACGITLTAFFALYSHQLYIFATVHYLGKDSQASSFFKSAIGFAVAEISNQGVFPLSLVGGISTMSLIAFSLCVAYSFSAQKTKYKGLLVSYILSCSFLVMTGLAGKFRNFVIIDPLKSACIALFDAKSCRGGRFAGKAAYCSMALILFSQMYGIANVVTHTGTTKNNWNIPAGEVFNIVRKVSSECPGGLAIFSHEPLFDWHFQRLGYSAYGPYGKRHFETKDNAPQCAIFINTFRGSVPTYRFANMKIERYDAVKNSRVTTKRIGRDSDYIAKRQLDPDFPEYNVELIDARGNLDLSRLENWQPMNK